MKKKSYKKASNKLATSKKEYKAAKKNMGKDITWTPEGQEDSEESVSYTVGAKLQDTAKRASTIKNKAKAYNPNLLRHNAKGKAINGYIRPRNAVTKVNKIGNTGSISTSGSAYNPGSLSANGEDTGYYDPNYHGYVSLPENANDVSQNSNAFSKATWYNKGLQGYRKRG